MKAHKTHNHAVIATRYRGIFGRDLLCYTPGCSEGAKDVAPDFQLDSFNEPANLSCVMSTTTIWHCRKGHANFTTAAKEGMLE